MGFNCSGLGPLDQQILMRLQPAITTLRGTALKMQQGGHAETKKWFGIALQYIGMGVARSAAFSDKRMGAPHGQA